MGLGGLHQPPELAQRDPPRRLQPGPRLWPRRPGPGRDRGDHAAARPARHAGASAIPEDARRPGPCRGAPGGDRLTAARSSDRRRRRRRREPGGDRHAPQRPGQCRRRWSPRGHRASAPGVGRPGSVARRDPPVPAAGGDPGLTPAWRGPTSGRSRKCGRTERRDWWMPGKDAGADVGTAGEARGERYTRLRGHSLAPPGAPRMRAYLRERPLAMRIAVAGGGPAGLYFSILMRRVAPDCQITVYERNRAEDAFGFGVVFSDETLTVFEHADPPGYRQITDSFVHWTDIDIHHRRVKTRSGGHGFSALGRRELLGILQRRALALGVDVRFETEAPPVDDLLAEADLVVGADGASSAVRAARAQDFDPSLDPRHCRYMWMGTDLVFDAFKFFIAETEHGVLQAHAYPYSDGMSTFIVEVAEETWRRAGLDQLTPGPLPPGVSDEASVRYCQELFADALEGHALQANNSKWINFVTVRNRAWRSGDNVALLGDAAHTAHFSIGSGTKLAMEDAVALAWL